MTSILTLFPGLRIITTKNHLPIYASVSKFLRDTIFIVNFYIGDQFKMYVYIERKYLCLLGSTVF